jgi:hypothetical protein
VQVLCGLSQYTYREKHFFGLIFVVFMVTSIKELNPGPQMDGKMDKIIEFMLE